MIVFSESFNIYCESGKDLLHSIAMTKPCKTTSSPRKCGTLFSRQTRLPDPNLKGCRVAGSPIWTKEIHT
jgi:hypothetical protein